MIKLLKIWMITMALGGGIICVPAQTDEGQGSVDPVENESPQEQQFSNREVMNRNTALLSGTVMVYLPSKSVVTPVEVPLTTTLAPITVSLVSSVTVPVILICACR